MAGIFYTALASQDTWPAAAAECLHFTAAGRINQAGCKAESALRGQVIQSSIVASWQRASPVDCPQTKPQVSTWDRNLNGMLQRCI